MRQWKKINETGKVDGYYLLLRKGFTYDVGNEADLIPEVGYWNGGRGCFNEDWDNKDYVYYMKLPNFPEVMV